KVKLGFGLKMELDVNDTNDPNVDKLTINIGIGTTANGYSQAGDADYLSFGQGVPLGAPPGITQLALQGVTLHAVEGQEVSAETYRVFFGDPQFVMTDIAVVPNFTGQIGGFLRNGPVAVPEPASMALLGASGIGLLCGRVWRRQRR